MLENHPNGKKKYTIIKVTYYNRIKKRNMHRATTKIHNVGTKLVCSVSNTTGKNMSTSMSIRIKKKKRCIGFS